MTVISGWVTNAAVNPTLGTIPKESVVKAVFVQDVTAFDSSGTDLLTVGHDAATAGYAASIDVSTVGVKTVTLGADVGRSEFARSAEAYYTAGGSAPTVGAAFVQIEFVTDLKIAKRLGRGRVVRRTRNAAVREIVPGRLVLVRR